MLSDDTAGDCVYTRTPHTAVGRRLFRIEIRRWRFRTNALFPAVLHPLTFSSTFGRFRLCARLIGLKANARHNFHFISPHRNFANDLLFRVFAYGKHTGKYIYVYSYMYIYIYICMRMYIAHTTGSLRYTSGV